MRFLSFGYPLTRRDSRAGVFGATRQEIENVGYEMLNRFERVNRPFWRAGQINNQAFSAASGDSSRQN